jgi:hypothetical protein
MLGKSKMSNFSVVHITKYNIRNDQYESKTLTEYKRILKGSPNMCENIGLPDQQIKPVFNVDAYDNDIDIDAIKAKINELFPDKQIHYAKREPRDYNGKMKFSSRWYVNEVHITSQNLKNL